MKDELVPFGQSCMLYIRASEKVFYHQILEIYATSIDYNPTAEESVRFFKKVQNKIHYAILGETAAEVIYHRVDAEKEFMGLNKKILKNNFELEVV